MTRSAPDSDSSCCGSARRRRTLTVVAAAALLACPAAAFAAPEEIQVYLDDMTPPGRFGLDVHNNYVFSGSTTPEWEGAQPPNHVYRFTPEFYYGLSDSIELGLYLLSTRNPEGDINYDGEKLRFKFVPPHDSQQGPFWGFNVEVGKTSDRVAQYPWNTELKGIFGYRADRWLFAINTNYDKAITRSGYPTAQLDTKIAYRTNAGYQIGLESYNELGPFKDLGHLGQQSQTLYAVIDTEVAGAELNAGIGRGLTGASDRWTLKFIVGFRY